MHLRVPPTTAPHNETGWRTRAFTPPASSAMAVVENPIHRSQSSRRAEATAAKNAGTVASSATIASDIAFNLEDSLYGEKREIASKNDHPDEDADAALTNAQWCEVSYYACVLHCTRTTAPTASVQHAGMAGD